MAPAGRNSVKQMSTGAVVPGSGTLVRQPSVVVTASAAAAGEATYGTEASARTPATAAVMRLAR